MKKKFLLVFSTILVITSLTNCGSTPSVNPSHEVKRVNFIDLEKGSSTPSLLDFFDNNPYVVYIPIENYQMYYPSYGISVLRDNNIFTFKNLYNNEKAILNGDNGILTYKCFSKFNELSDIPHQEIFYPSLLNSKLVESESSYKAGKEYSIDLSKYNLKPIKDNSNYYMPLDLLMRIDPNSNRGTAYYDGEENVTLLDGNVLDQYQGKLIGSYPSSFYEYSYNLFAFDVDNIYGLNGYSRPLRHDNFKSYTFNKEGAIKTFASYKDDILKATSTLEFDIAFDKLFELIDDGGHTIVLSGSIATDEDKLPKTFGQHKETQYLRETYKNEGIARGKALDQQHDTPICSFDADNDGIDDIGYFHLKSFTLNGIYAIQKLLPQANISFNKKVNPSSTIKDVVIDLADNGGGNTAAEGVLLSWICNGKGKQILKDARDGSITTTVCQCDVNGDGNYDELDYLPTDINIYILSDATFSAATACVFDSYMYTFSDEYKQIGKNIKFIGRPNLGGACSITNTTLLPTCFGYHMSSNSVSIDHRDESKTCDEIMPLSEGFEMSVSQIADRTGYINPKIVASRK